MEECGAHDGFVVGLNSAKLSFETDFNPKIIKNVKFRKKSH